MRLDLYADIVCLQAVLMWKPEFGKPYGDDGRPAHTGSQAKRGIISGASERSNLETHGKE